MAAALSVAAQEVIVVGAGIVGLAAGYELGAAGHRVTVVSADVPGDRQSAGLSRIFRLAHADRALTDAAAVSRGLWEEWQAAAGETLLVPTGLLLTGDMADRAVHLRRHGGLATVHGDHHPLAAGPLEWGFEATGGAILAEATIRFLVQAMELRLARVTRVAADRVELAGGERLAADRVVVCAGPDTYGLLGRLAPERWRSVRFSFALREPLAAPAPSWIHRDDRLCEPFYAVMDGPDHYSIGLSGAGRPDQPLDEHVREAHARVTAIVRRIFPGLVPVAERVIACEYPLNPNAGQSARARDGWDLHDAGGVIGLTGPSLFKFAPLLGRMVAERVGADTP